MPDEQAELLRALHDEHAPALWRYVVWLTGDRQLAEDVVQETLVRAWQRPQVLEQGGASARAWLFTVARNIIVDERRSAHSRHELSTDTPPERAVDDGTDALLDAWLVDQTDAAAVPAIEAAGIRATAVPLWMRDLESSGRLAADALDAAR